MIVTIVYKLDFMNICRYEYINKYMYNLPFILAYTSLTAVIININDMQLIKTILRSVIYNNKINTGILNRFY